MAYSKPVCDCGEELDVVVSAMHTDTYNVTKNGKVAKTKKRETATEVWVIDLQCPACCAAYGFTEDENERVIRGELKEN